MAERSFVAEYSKSDLRKFTRDCNMIFTELEPPMKSKAIVFTGESGISTKAS